MTAVNYIVSVDDLIDADRVVLAGLSAYDQCMARAWVTVASTLTADGFQDDQIAEIKADHLERARLGRGRVHREIWTKALVFIARDTPGKEKVAV